MNSIKWIIATLVTAAVWSMSSCTSLPEGVSPVKSFEADRYLGKWYEIARIDHKFEKGLSRVTAEYSRKDDGGISVLNRGFNKKLGEWKEAKGKAYFIDESDMAHLKVSFFGPFYSSYVVFGLDKKRYQWSYVSGYNHDYLWLLSRSPTMTSKQKNQFIKKAKALGFDTEKIIFVEH